MVPQYNMPAIDLSEYDMPLISDSDHGHSRLAYLFARNTAKHAPKFTRRYTVDRLAFDTRNIIQLGDFATPDSHYFEYIFSNCVFKQAFCVCTIGPVKIKFVNCKFYQSVTVSDTVSLSFVKCFFHENVTVYRADRAAVHQSTFRAYIHASPTNTVRAHDCGSVRLSDIRYPIDFFSNYSKYVSLADSAVGSVYVKGDKYNRFRPKKLSLSMTGSGASKLSTENISIVIRLSGSVVGSADITHTVIASVSVRNSSVQKFFAAYDSQLPSDKCSQDAIRNALDGVPTFSYRSYNVPQTPFTMYKKARVYLKIGPFLFPKNTVIVTLQVPESAERLYSKGSGKIRVSEAKVAAFSEIVKFPYTVRSYHFKDFPYILGQTVKPKHGFDRSDEECSGGIHGFLDFNDAERY